MCKSGSNCLVQVEDMEQLVQAINRAVQNKEEIAKVKEVAQRITSYNMGDFPRGWEEVKALCSIVDIIHWLLCP